MTEENITPGSPLEAEGNVAGDSGEAGSSAAVAEVFNPEAGVAAAEEGTFEQIAGRETDKRRLQELEEELRAKNYGEVSIRDMKEELREDVRQYKQGAEEILLRKMNPVMRIVTKAMLKLKMVSLEDVAKERKKGLEGTIGELDRENDKIRKDIRKIYKEVDFKEVHLAKTYEFDLIAERQIDAYNNDIARLGAEIKELQKGSREKLGKNPTKEIEKKKTELRRAEEYVRDIDKKRMDNADQSLTLDYEIRELRDNLGYYDVESKRIGAKRSVKMRQILPVGTAIGMAVRRMETLEVEARAEVQSEQVEEYAITAREQNDRIFTKLLGSTQIGSSGARGGDYNESRERREEAMRNFAQMRQVALDEMRRRRTEYFDGS